MRLIASSLGGSLQHDSIESFDDDANIESRRVAASPPNMNEIVRLN